MRFLRISVFTAIERNEATTKVAEAIAGCGGWIVSHSLFSNAMTTINFELPLNKTESLIERLENTGLQPKVDGELPQGERGDLHGQIALNFLDPGPDLRREVPPFG